MRGIVVERESVCFKFEGELEEVSVETFTQAVMGYASMLQIAASEVSPETRVDVVISGTRSGCFEAQLAAVAADVKGLIAAAVSSGVLKASMDTVRSYLELRRFLSKSGAPTAIRREGDQSQVITNNGTMTVNNIVLKVESRDDMNKAARGLFSTLASNEAVSGVTITDGGGGFNAPEDELSRLEDAPRCAVDCERVEVEERQMLAVVAPVLIRDSGRKWQLNWQGFKISAVVADGGIYERLESHEWSFGIGDYVEADLEVTQRRTDQGVWENKSFRILKVYDVKTAPRDQTLF